MFKKKNYGINEVVLEGTEMLLYTRQGYWQVRIYLSDEGKYLRRSLRTGSLDIAKERAMILWRELERDRYLGKKQFSIGIEQGIDNYLEMRREEVKDVGQGGITEGRFSTITSQLKAFRRYMRQHKANARVSDIEVRDCWNYFNWRQAERGDESIALSTLRNEKAMINACVRYWYDSGLTNVATLAFPKLRLLDDTDERVERETFKKNEFISFRRSAEEYLKARGELIDEKERLARKVFYEWIMIAVNTGLRTGEQRQLRWENVRLYENKDGTQFAEIRVLASTSKVRKTRTIPTRTYKYFVRLREVTGGVGYVFSLDEGETFISKRIFYRLWQDVLSKSGIENQRKEYLQPYSLRHYFITQRINHGVNAGTLAKLCGTSIHQISTTYYRLEQSVAEKAAILGRRIEELDIVEDD